MAFSEKELEVQKEYLDTLNTLNCNSKPLIDVLTDIAEESREFARVIVKCIEDQIEKVPVDLKLPILYLIDSIIKKEQDDPVYTQLFCCRLHLIFAKVYKEGKEDVRSRLLKLRVTWNGILPPVILSAIDNEVRKVNSTLPSGRAVHINPKFIPQGSTAVPFVINSMKTENVSQMNPPESTKKDILMKRQQEYLALKKKAELLERMKLQPPVKTDEKNDRISTLTKQIFTDAEKFKDGADNPSDIEKVRESAFSIKSSLLKSREQLIKDTGHCNHATLNDLILKLENTIAELDKLIASQKGSVGKNQLSRIPTSSAAPASKPGVSKSGAMPRAWLSKNSSTSLYTCSKPASNGTTSAASQNPPAFRIAPVNSQLINAVARRPRDPRLRKFEEQESSTNVSRVTATVEEEVSPASTTIDTKNDEQNVLLTDVSKMKDFVSDVTSTSSVPAVSPHPSKAADLKTVVQVDRKSNRQFEKRASPSKSSKSSNVESSKRDGNPVLKSSCVPSSSSVTIKENSSLYEAGSSNIESIIPAAPSISGEKPSTNPMRDPSTVKKESKPTKIRVKVVQKVTKEKPSKRTPVAPSESIPPESAMPTTSQNGSKEHAVEKSAPTMTREERNKKINALAVMLVKIDEKQRKIFLENLSKTHVKLAQKLEKVVKKKLATVVAKPNVAEASTPPAPPISTVASPIIIDELMDITEDKNDFMFVSGPDSSEAQENTTSSTVTKFDQPEAVVDTTNEMSDEVQSKCEVISVLMDISEDSEEKTPQPLEENSPSAVEGVSEKSVPKSPNAPMNLSEQLEAVMNASSTDAVPSSGTQDVDIRPLLPNSISLQLNCTLPVVPDMTAPAIPISTDPVDTSAAAPFNNPFGLSQVPTKDIDYRQLFAFPLPTIPSTTESVVKPVSTNQVSSSVPDAQSSTPAVPNLTIDVDDPPADKVATKRKPEDEPSEGSKRRRTISVSSTSSGDSDSELKPVAETVSKSCSLEPQPSTLPLPPMASALENILNMPSDSDEDVAESMDGGDRAGSSRGKREQSSYSQTAVVNEDDHSSDAFMVPPMEPRPASKSPPMFPMLTPNPSFCTPNFSMFLATTPEIPEANVDVLRMIRRDPVRSIHIDGISREIRHYGSTAVTFLNWDDPRQISFYNGLRKIIIDNDVEIPCYLNGPDVEYKLYGVYHRFRLGAPTRELYIDGIGYECYFDGSSKRIRIGNLYRSVRLAGGPPRVHIGQKKRQDLVAGKIDVIIDEEHTIPVYLDAKPQAIYVKGIPFIIMFIDSLKRVLINDFPFRTAFGGLPQSFKFKGKVYSFRFDMLPAGIVPGAVSIFQMIMTKLPSPPPLPPSLRYCEDLPTIYTPSVPNIPISSAPSVDIKPAVARDNAPSELKPPPLLENVNIDELFQKLVASGIVPTPHHSEEPESKPIVESKKPVEHTTVRFVDFSKPETLKQKQPALVSKLYSGIQCGSCGLRFPQEQTVKYSQHLDWHFRLNRRGKDGARMIHSRKWYYNSSDWMQFQEMEDNTDRGTSWFENQAATEYTEKEEEEVPCVSAGENAQDAVCVLCQDKFDQFYNQDTEEWQLRNAIRVDGTLYHPTCHQDHTERKDDHSDIEEIVDLEEPIALDDSSPVEELSVNLLENENAEANVDGPVVNENLVNENSTDLSQIVTINDDSIVIKQEKPDAPKLTRQTNGSQKSMNTNEETTATPASSEKNTENEDDSDVEEVQLIEEPIEEIIINDDINDLEPNLETLNVEDIIAVQKEVDSLAEEVVAEVEPVEIADKVVDITGVPNVATIDGNIEVGESLQVVSTGKKIKLNIVKPATHNEEKIHSPISPANEVEPISDTEMDDLPNGPPKELTTINAQPLPPGEELVTAAEIKPKLKERKLTEYPPVTKGTEISGLCSIM